MAPAASKIPYLPFEIIEMIGYQTNDLTDVLNMRLACKRFNHACLRPFQVLFMMTTKLYATRSGMEKFHNLAQNKQVATRVTELHLVGQTFVEHKYGYAWAWEQIINDNYLDWYDNAKDQSIMEKVTQLHSSLVAQNFPWVTNGGYRKDLTSLFSMLPNLNRVYASPFMKRGEHIPGWEGVNLVKQLTGYRQGLIRDDLFYGIWMWDELHKRVTVTEDEYGETVAEDGYGPQATFDDDLEEALYDNGLTPDNVYID